MTRYIITAEVHVEDEQKVITAAIPFNRGRALPTIETSLLDLFVNCPQGSPLDFGAEIVRMEAKKVALSE